MAPSPVPRSKRTSSLAAAAVAALVCAGTGNAASAADSSFEKPRALKVCDDPNNLPFSNDRGEGFENKIAQLIARDLDLPLEVFHYPQRINLVRNTIRYKLPNESEYRCDLLPGVPSDFSAVATTQPYFRSTYVLVFARGRKIEAGTAEDFLALDRALLSTLKIGIYERTPAVEWLRKHDLLGQAVPYRLLNPDPSHYPGKIIEEDLAQGKLDAVVVWGPIGGFFARRIRSPDLVVLPLGSEPGLRMHFGVSMGLRQGEDEWRAMIQQALDRSHDDILRILGEYGVPMVDEKGNSIR